MSDPIRISVSPQWFQFIKDGRKSVEGRLNKGKMIRKSKSKIVYNSI